MIRAYKTVETFSLSQLKTLGFQVESHVANPKKEMK